MSKAKFAEWTTMSGKSAVSLPNNHLSMHRMRLTKTRPQIFHHEFPEDRQVGFSHWLAFETRHHRPHFASKTPSTK